MQIMVEKGGRDQRLGVMVCTCMNPLLKITEADLLKFYDVVSGQTVIIDLKKTAIQNIKPGG